MAFTKKTTRKAPVRKTTKAMAELKEAPVKKVVPKKAPAKKETWFGRGWRGW